MALRFWKVCNEGHQSRLSYGRTKPRDQRKAPKYPKEEKRLLSVGGVSNLWRLRKVAKARVSFRKASNSERSGDVKEMQRDGFLYSYSYWSPGRHDPRETKRPDSTSGAREIMTETWRPAGLRI
ncbi:hypothetical protein Pyn_19892 [Prunus yedoensis var. nudiflora]|uniref:Uncharacterized protein n=1 Tax=Prunus yedoensis var. nudiflora TaxID=2094558 RepID=A0A314ZWL3_PRUYE|nr:hypothetical protein Pyn_19892 [Prunus yedoensis var. nudiflora]